MSPRAASRATKFFLIVGLLVDSPGFAIPGSHSVPDPRFTPYQEPADASARPGRMPEVQPPGVPARPPAEPEGEPAYTSGRRGLEPFGLTARIGEASALDGVWEERLTPLARRTHTAVYDSARHRMVVFGGTDISHRLNDVWALRLGALAAWERVAPAGRPPSRRDGHTAIYDPLGDRMIVYGGVAGVEDTVWILTLGDAPAWEAVRPVGVSPPSRWGQSAIYDPLRHQMVIFGGWGPGPNNQSDVWVLELGASPTWQHLEVSGIPPSARGDHTAIYDAPRDRMIVFGGFDGARRNDVWALTLGANPTWALLGTCGVLPLPRYGHAAAFDPTRNRMLIFGGYDMYGAAHDVWALTFAICPAWTKLVPTGTEPASRYDHTMIYDPQGDAMLVFGGGYASARSDVWALTLSATPSWTRLAPAGALPSRTNAAVIHDPIRDRMLVFGGHDGSTNHNEILALALGARRDWEEIVTAGTPPSPRSGQVGVYDPVRDRMIVFGGWDGACREDVWTLTLAGNPTWEQMEVAGTAPSGRYRSTAIYDPVGDRVIIFGGWDCTGPTHDLWALSLGGRPAWVPVATVGSPPPARYDHAAIYHPARGRMVLHGGYGAGAGNDLWALALGRSPTWTQIVPAGETAPGRSGHSAIYDPVRDRMVVSCGVFNSDETWCLSLGESPTWTASEPLAPHSPARYGHAAIYDAARDHMVVSLGSDWDTYQRTDTWRLVWDTPVSALVSLTRAEATADRVVLVWHGADAAGQGAAVERRTTEEDWRRLAEIVADGTGTYRYEDLAVIPGDQYAYRLAYRSGPEITYTPEHWVKVPEAILSLEGPTPSPASDAFGVMLSLPNPGPATLEVFDVAGRRTFSRDVGGLGPGTHRVRLDEARGFPPGVYTLRLTQGGRFLTARGVVLR